MLVHAESTMQKATHEVACRGSELANRTCHFCNRVSTTASARRKHEKLCAPPGTVFGRKGIEGVHY
eukprot:5863240-Amphidinium_carterae.2